MREKVDFLDLEFLIKQKFDNLADVPDNQDLIVKYLLHRYEEGNIYTWVGPVLLTINPGIPNPKLYDKIHQDNLAHPPNFSEKPARVEPHLFSLAATARYRLIQGLGKEHQVIVISGDSGSGKTFSASKILRFLAATNGEATSLENSTFSTLSKIEKACLIISAFSTASTERNERSSRHGQLIQLQYFNASIMGAIVNSFLLEQSRVTSGCDNFFIFGQMLAGLSETNLKTLHLSGDKSYKIAKSSVNTAEFVETVEAMASLGLGDNQRQEIFKVIAILIHLGNIEFKENITAGCDIDIDEKDSTNALEGACRLMGLPTSNLTKLLTTNLIRPRTKSQRHSTYLTLIATTEGCNSRLHSIIKHVYNRLFQWLLGRLNEILSCEEQSPRLLGILDIFGFEFFSENSIEQLSINYANERMQDYFMKKYLEASRSEMEIEGLSALPPSPKFCLHKQRLKAIEYGLFPAINDACLIARIEKRTSLDEVAIFGKKEFEKVVSKRGDNFAVCHYSCTVEYRTADILRKNTDKVPAELLSTFILCQNKFIFLILNCNEENEERCRFDKKKNTALAKLKHSMDSLITELEKYDPHYVRCMRPIDLVSDPGVMKDFKEQLACSGIFDALTLAKCTLPIRMRYDEFSQRYSKRREIDETDPKHRCEVILKREFNETEIISSVHFGSKLIFLGEAIVYKLEAMRDQLRSQCASRIQACWYHYKLRKRSEADQSSMKNPDSEYLNTEQRHVSCDTIFNQKNAINELSSPRASSLGKEETELLGGARISDNCDSPNDFVTALNNREFFLRNRILSRRRLADIPVRFHTRSTCLMESHRLPRSELPQGLRDCL